MFGVVAAAKYCKLVEGKFINFTLCLLPKRQVNFELFLSIDIYFYIFSQVLNFTSVELNRFAKQAFKKLLKTSF